MEALVENYQIEPAGSPDYWSKTQKIQRALMRMQTLSGHPNVRQDELVKEFIAADSPDMVKRLWMASGQQAADETEDEQIEIEALLMNGSMAQIRASEDHALRVRVLFQKLQALSQLGLPLDPLAKQRLLEHLQGHMQYLAQQNPKLSRQIQQAAAVLDPATQGPEQAQQALQGPQVTQAPQAPAGLPMQPQAA